MAWVEGENSWILWINIPLCAPWAAGDITIKPLLDRRMKKKKLINSLDAGALKLVMGHLQAHRHCRDLPVWTTDSQSALPRSLQHEGLLTL